MSTYRRVINDDITAGHVTMKNMLFQVLDERALKTERQLQSILKFSHDNNMDCGLVGTQNPV